MHVALPVLQASSAPEGAEFLVEVSFKGNRRGFYLSADESLRDGDHVVVEAERGQDLGQIRSRGGVAKSKCVASDSAATQRIVRLADPSEVRQAIVLRADEERVRRQTRELVEKHKLKMKVSDAEWQWDRNKLTVYFTAERRVDFRELVRDLARTFRTRIELKQIGVRDEAALLGGVGRCGRQLCCATWLREIRPVSLQLAKDQHLSLNPSQISGTCGRLMCCLTYEHDAYLQARKRFPREGKLLQTSRGAERVIGVDIWRDTVTLLDESKQRRLVTLAELKREMGGAVTGKREREPEDDLEASATSGAPEARAEPPPPGEARPTEHPRDQKRPRNGRNSAPQQSAETAPAMAPVPAEAAADASTEAGANAGRRQRPRRKRGRGRGGPRRE